MITRAKFQHLFGRLSMERKRQLLLTCARARAEGLSQSKAWASAASLLTQRELRLAETLASESRKAARRHQRMMRAAGVRICHACGQSCPATAADVRQTSPRLLSSAKATAGTAASVSSARKSVCATKRPGRNTAPRRNAASATGAGVQARRSATRSQPGPQVRHAPPSTKTSRSSAHPSRKRKAATAN